jgi:hypothetical protein
MPSSTALGYTYKPGADSRLILAFMFFAGIEAIIAQEKKAAAKGQIYVATPARIILGGTVATVMLTLLAHAGEGGKKFAIGLAGVTFASSTLINGSAVFGSVNTLLGYKPTKASTPSTPSTPTTGLKTVTTIVPTALGGL